MSYIKKKSLFKAWRLFIYTLLAIWFAKGFCFPVIETYNYDFPKWSCYQIWWKSWLILCLLVTRSFFFCFSTNYKSNQGEAIRPRRLGHPVCKTRKSKTLQILCSNIYLPLPHYCSCYIMKVMFLQRRKNVYLQRLLL